MQETMQYQHRVVPISKVRQKSINNFFKIRLIIWTVCIAPALYVCMSYIPISTGAKMLMNWHIEARLYLGRHNQLDEPSPYAPALY